MVQPKDLVFTTDSSPTSENQVVILFVREETIIQKQVVYVLQVIVAPLCEERERSSIACFGWTKHSDNNQQRKKSLAHI